MFFGTSSIEMIETQSYRSDQSRGSSLDSSFAPGIVPLETTDITSTTPSDVYFNPGKVISKVSKTLSLLKITSLNASLITPGRSVADSSELCAICLSEIRVENSDDYKITNCCEHKFHKQCISRWKMEQLKCPLCRAGLSQEQGESLMVHEFPSWEIVGLIISWLTRENGNSVSTKEAIANILLAPFGFAWVVLSIVLVWLAEILCLCLVTPLVLLEHMLEVCNNRPRYYCYHLFETLCMVMYLTLITFTLMAPAIVFLFCQFFGLICLAGAFCFKVCRCRRRWQDAIPYMARRAILYSL